VKPPVTARLIIPCARRGDWVLRWAWNTPRRPWPCTVKQGYLTSVRGLTLFVDRLDDLGGPIRVHAERLSGDARLVLYQFELEHGGVCLLAGRASVVLDAQAL
jgi:predicted hotdog family 3-hydroxylacyl-ACP dehydratase